MVFHLLRVCGMGLVGFLFPRILVALGVPLDQWAVELAAWVTGGAVMLSQEDALLWVGGIAALVILSVELWQTPAAKAVAWAKSRSGVRVGSTDLPGVQSDAAHTGQMGLEETDTEISTALLLITDLSSWMRWQDAQRIGDGRVALTADGKINLAETVLRQRLEEGRLSARGRRRGTLEYEKIPTDLWKIIYLDIQRDPRTLWRAKMTPRDGLEQEAIERIPDYVSIQVSEKQIKESWPAMDTRLDRESALLLKLALRGPNREPIVLAELEMTVPKIGDFTPVCSIRIKNTGPPLEDKCLVKVEKHGLENHMPDPLVVRTEGQIRNDRTGPFTLRAGEPKLVPIFFRDPGRINEFRFIGEDKNHYSFIGDSAEFEVAIYGAEHPTRVSIRLNVGEDWKVHAEMEYC